MNSGAQRQFPWCLPVPGAGTSAPADDARARRARRPSRRCTEAGSLGPKALTAACERGWRTSPAGPSPAVVRRLLPAAAVRGPPAPPLAFPCPRTLRWRCLAKARKEARTSPTGALFLGPRESGVMSPCLPMRKLASLSGADRVGHPFQPQVRQWRLVPPPPSLPCWCSPEPACGVRTNRRVVPGAGYGCRCGGATGLRGPGPLSGGACVGPTARLWLREHRAAPGSRQQRGHGVPWAVPPSSPLRLLVAAREPWLCPHISRLLFLEKLVHLGAAGRLAASSRCPRGHSP